MTYDSRPGDLPSSAKVTRVIDMKLPLTWLLSVAAAIVGGGFGLYYKLDRLGEDVAEMKVAVKSGNQTTSTIQGRLAILEFRLDTIDAERKAGR